MLLGLRLSMLAALALASACGERKIDVTKEAPEYYLVSSHEAATGEWIILHVDKVEHTQVEIRAVCDYYHWAGHDMVKGPNSCDLVVGQRIEPNPLHSRPGDFVMVWRQSNSIQIQRGTGADQVTEGVRVISARVIAQ